MATEPDITSDLHLPDLRIKGFRGIKDLHISRLGRVTLLAGKNGVGKTTVLEAVRVYAARGRQETLAEMMHNREENEYSFDDDFDRDTLAPSWEALFYGRILSSDSSLSIGPENGDQVHIKTKLAPTHLDLSSIGSQFPDEVLYLQVSFQGSEYEFSTIRRERRRTVSGGLALPLVVRCDSLGPDLPSSSQLARFWDGVALTDEESRAVDALNLTYSGGVERIAMIGDDIVRRRRGTGRKAVVKLRDEPRPIPLKSLGDGAVRMFTVALALANSKDGFLLIDEAENGIHHSIQRDFWTMLLKAAHQNNVQVLATTHSWDCVAGFAMAAMEVEEVDGALVRIDRHGDKLRAVEYTEDDLRVAAKHGIEVR